jgi:hypothetical protein
MPPIRRPGFGTSPADPCFCVLVQRVHRGDFDIGRGNGNAHAGSLDAKSVPLTT